MAGEPRTEAGRRLRDDRDVETSGLAEHPHPEYVEACWFCDAIRAIEDEALASEREMAWHANRSARAALTAAIADLRGRHVWKYPPWSAEKWCAQCEKPWPCPDALLAYRLEEATK